MMKNARAAIPSNRHHLVWQLGRIQLPFLKDDDFHLGKLSGASLMPNAERPQPSNKRAGSLETTSRCIVFD